MLINPETIKLNGWETHLTGKVPYQGNYLENQLTGIVIHMGKTNTGLPTIPIKFYNDDESVGSLKCDQIKPCEEELVTFYAKNKLILPRRLKQAVHNENGKPFQSKAHDELLEHQRMGHMSEYNSKRIPCMECIEHKGRKLGHSATRPEKNVTPTPLMLFATDFFGKVRPDSYRKNTYVLLFICDACGYAYGKPIKYKSEAPDALVDFVAKVRNKCGIPYGKDETT